MDVLYTDERIYLGEDVKQLFESVSWLLAKYHNRVKKALDNLYMRLIKLK